ncbi:2-succinyl-5-enolpyruvyl-6-hydroxy-3-cyclohexene-1-carboxylic-acid synthase [Tepidibacillus sp. HK-1]|uniref:2-succinyl-5-enolpyruvyl-6-hydroxy-3- cyclohexene-1-carboxylic-acid synthase n=1 Tax=Tepidibacillus sp. HK-1 TaxID=1883407 RepID=UPI0008534B00|nr:2-succinyl-5-enolpyruvyl-6-hydroxy-3-cyclohexene-1-carboxylic-acid synthase [Tepidibacillus sp. HK-1]GBF12259.1 2-succinyl-5-enolpyruvyl-6-hydroxy-3-cyclohexene-1-carboxylate synthase [Tepidibacillus sp. HK-1]
MSNEAMTYYLASFVDELARLGVCDAVVSPGSRSTPIAILMAEHSRIKVWMHADERSAGFFALGMAKEMRKPVVLLCTSGTATANYLPAIVEAHQSRIPLLVLTADRPHELRDVGAPQAIDQIHLYGRYAKWFVDMALPESTFSMLHYVRTMAGRAVAMAANGPAGVVHLNFPLREPLVPNLDLQDLWEKGRSEGKPYIKVTKGNLELSSDELKLLAEELQEVENGLIICGPEDHLELSQALTRLADKLQFPILADPLSPLRTGSHSKQWVIDSYDSFLRNDEVKTSFKPELILRFGAMPISKALLQYIQHHSEARQIIIDQDQGWREPTLMASKMIYADPIRFSYSLAEYLEKRKEPSLWGTKWKQLNEISQFHMQTFGKMESLFEGQVVIELQQLLPEHAILFVGNSMPVRDLDTFLANTDKPLRTMANRGANGIDGVVSSALGATVSGSPLVLVIGDLSFYHDLNGLLAAKLHQLNATIVLINNNGGGIFSFLPQSKQEKHFELLFGTPLDLEFEHVVKMYGGRYKRIKDWQEFRLAVNQSLSTVGLDVIEILTNRQENEQLHRKLWHSLSEKISKWKVQVDQDENRG